MRDRCIGPARTLARTGRALLGVLLLLVAAAATSGDARAADRVYWTTFNGKILAADPSGEGPVTTLYTGQSVPRGIDVDLAGNRLIWSRDRYDWDDDDEASIRFGPLDGGAPPQELVSAEDHVSGIAIDLAGGRVIWQRPLGLAAAPLAGGERSPLYSPPQGPEDGSVVAVDDVNGRVYFDSGAGGQSIWSAPLDGSGPVDFLYGGSSDEFIGGLAVDPVRGFVYWTVANVGAVFPRTDEIRRAPLDGSGPEQVLYAGEYGSGIAVDAAEGYLYWANRGSIRRAPMDGGGPIEIVAATPLPYGIVLLRTPLSTGAPQVSGGSTVGSELTCSGGSWTSENIHGSFVHRPPITGFAYRWQRGGTDVEGARAATYTPSEPGDYRCVVTATNSAGDRDAASPSHTVTSVPAGDPGPVQTLTLGNAYLSRAGAIVVPITCINRVSGHCDTTLTMRFRKPTHGFRAITRELRLAAGTSLTRIVLSRKQRRKLRRIRRLGVSVTLTNPPGAAITRDSTLHGRTRLGRSSSSR